MPVRYLICLLILSAFGGLDSINSEYAQQPNIVLILTDDQDVVLQGLFPMANTQRLLGMKGVTFPNAFTTSPICCPSRASILSGMYAHNHATKNNSVAGGCFGEFWKSHIEPHALPVQLENNGYETFFAGKYLNEYYSEHVPPGWTNFYGLHGNSKYYNYTLTENGKIVHYTDQYLTDLLNEKTISFLKNRTSTKPFFAMIAPPAPHAPYTPAARHNETFIGTKALRTPNFNTLSGPLDKHWLVSSGRKMSSALIENLDLYFTSRWESLLAVDELVSNLVRTLEKTGKIDNTYIVYTSDNGYHIGQFAQPFDKRQPYETDIRVPFLIRGPNVPQKGVSMIPVALIDLVPTFLEWANIKTSGDEDGLSFNAYLMNPRYDQSNDKYFHRQVLIEYWGEGNVDTFNFECPGKKSDQLAYCTKESDCHCQDSWNNTYACVRHFAFNTNKLYCEFKDRENFVEAYDLHLDPYEMTNLGYELLPSERAMYSLALHNLTKCIGESCRNTRF